MNIVVQLEERAGTAPGVAYQWDPDTDILSARIQPSPASDGDAGSVEIQGADGSWVILDVADGQLGGLEVAVWPEVNKNSALKPPAVRDALVRFPSGGSASAVTAVEVETPIAAESDPAEHIFHFRFGVPQPTTAVRVATELLLEVDGKNRVVGLWLLNVPPFPDEP
ncbi:MAG TPA: hypothetical protein VIJ16_02610 [Gemmatimonadaceae bacterium]